MIHQPTLKLIVGFSFICIPIILFPQNDSSRQDTSWSDKITLQPARDNSVTQTAIIRSSPGANPDISAIGDFRSSTSSSASERIP